MNMWPYERLPTWLNDRINQIYANVYDVGGGAMKATELLNFNYHKLMGVQL